MNSVRLLAAKVSLALLLSCVVAQAAGADGVEMLGAPGISIASGTGIVSAGTGLISQPGAIDVTVPAGASVLQVLLYWEGLSLSPAPGDDTIEVNGIDVTGTSIGASAGSSFVSAGFRADITGLGLVSPGANSLVVGGLDFAPGVANGAGVLVVIDDGSGGVIDIRDGVDIAFAPAPAPFDTTVPQTFVFAPSSSDRTASLDMFFTSVSGTNSGGGFRPSAITMTVDGTTTVFDNLLDSVDGDEWDTTRTAVPVPAGATTVTIQALSVDNLGIGGLVASFDWIAAGLTIAPDRDEPGIDIEKQTSSAGPEDGQQADGANDPDVPVIPPGDTVIWIYTVTNTGNVPFDFDEVVVTDDQPGVFPVYDSGDDGDSILSPDEVWFYLATLPAENLSTTTSGVTIVPGCDPGDTGMTRPTYENIGTVTARSLMDEDPSHYCNPPDPGIDIEKFTNGNQADGANDSDVPEIAPGDTVTWTYLVTNTGDVAFDSTEVLVTDDQSAFSGVSPMFVPGGGTDDGDGVLSPGEVWEYTASILAENLATSTSGVSIVDGCDPDMTGLPRPTYENVGTVTARDQMDFDPSHYCNPPGECILEVGKFCSVPQPPSTGDDCQGKVLEAVFRYIGGACADPLGNPQGGKAKCSGDPGGAPVTVVITKDESKISATPASGILVGDTVSIAKNDGKELGADTKFDVIGSGGPQSLEIHTSCSKPLAVGDVFGSVQLFELTTTEGGTVTLEEPSTELTNECELPEAPPAPHCTSKVLELTLRYLGGDCPTPSGNSQGSKAKCEGGDPGGDVSIAITKDADKVSASPSSGLEVGDLVSIAKNDGKELGSETKFDASGSGGTQSIALHTSCSQPLDLGDRFGAFEVFAIDRKDDGPVAIGGTVEYQYAISNPNGGSVDNVSVFDDQLGPIADGLTVGSGESISLFREATISETTTNTVFVNGTADGVQCAEAMAEATVTVVPPPPPPPEAFDCSDAKPITSLSLIWAGPSGVDIVTEGGEGIAGIQNGDEITISTADLGNDVDLTISGAVSGESRFHVSCSDSQMNGPEDCGSPQGDGKKDDSGLNLWLFEGMAGDLALDCTP